MISRCRKRETRRRIAVVEEEIDCQNIKVKVKLQGEAKERQEDEE